MPRLICLLLVAAVLGGCGRIPTPRLGFMNAVTPAEALPYDAKLIADRRAADFSVAVTGGEAGLDAVRETVRFQGTRHCLANFGSSSITWAAAPGDPQAWTATRTESGQQVYSGRCLGR